MKSRLPATIALASAIVALSACTSTGTDKTADTAPPPASTEPTSCGAEQFASYIGQPASDSVIAAITASRGDKPMRVVKPGMAVTMDYMPERLNVQVGEDGKITRFTCT